MPKDEWAKARRNDAARKARWRPGVKKAKKQRRGKRHCHKTSAWNSNTVLWFGKHKGEALHDVPPAYLHWLISQPPHSSWRINELCEYLRSDRSSLVSSTACDTTAAKV